MFIKRRLFHDDTRSILFAFPFKNHRRKDQTAAVYAYMNIDI